MAMNIRTSADGDIDDIQDVYLKAFPETENETIVKLSRELLTEKSHTSVIDLLAETQDEIAGHIIFSPVTIDGHKDIRAYILAPLGVKPDHQKSGIGSKLIDEGLEQLSASGINIVFVYGDPAYYGKFEFSADAAEQYQPPHDLEYPFGWQAIVLNEFDAVSSPASITCVAPLRDPKLW
jgi:putative acetyltransferase